MHFSKVSKLRPKSGVDYHLNHRNIDNIMSTSGVAFEQELCSLSIKAIQQNPHLLPLHKALRIESFNGKYHAFLPF